MFFKPLVLLAMASPIFATFPDLPDVQSFMPNIMEMVPFNGQIRFNDQVFNFGAPTTTSTLDVQTQSGDTPRVDVPQTSSVLPEISTNMESSSLPPLLNLLNDVSAPPAPLPQNNGPIIGENISMRSQDAPLPAPLPASLPAQLSPPLFASPQPIPQSLPMNESPSNFQSRIPSLDSLLSNMRSQPSTFNGFNTLPNIGSTEVGSTFARNANSDFRDEFSQPSSATPLPFGFPSTPSPMNVPMGGMRSNFGGTDPSLVVMPLVVSPDRLLQSGNSDMSRMASNAIPIRIPIPSLFSSTNMRSQPSTFNGFNDHSMQASEREESVQPLPLETMTLFGTQKTNGSTDGSEVISRQTTFRLPAPIVTQLSNDSNAKERHLDAALERHVRTILRNATERSDSPLKTFTIEKIESEPQTPLSLDQIEENEKQTKRSQKPEPNQTTTPQTTPKTESSEETLKVKDN